MCCENTELHKLKIRPLLLKSSCKNKKNFLLLFLYFAILSDS